jgi:hypothetical protein
MRSLAVLPIDKTYSRLFFGFESTPNNKKSEKFNLIFANPLSLLRDVTC